MKDNYIDIPSTVNEPVRDYAPGSDEQSSLKSKLAEMETEFYEKINCLAPVKAGVKLP